MPWSSRLRRDELDSEATAGMSNSSPPMSMPMLHILIILRAPTVCHKIVHQIVCEALLSAKRPKARRPFGVSLPTRRHHTITRILNKGCPVISHDLALEGSITI